jgi:hypothetical protein
MATTSYLDIVSRHLSDQWAHLPDHRKPNNNQQYEIADAVRSAYAVFFVQSESFLAHQREMHEKRGRSNIGTLFQAQSVPSDPQIRNLLDPLRPEDLEPDFEWLLAAVDQAGQLDRFRDYAGSLLVALDGVTYFSSDKISCDQCSQRTSSNGKVRYFHSVITPVIVKPDRAEVLPLPPEFIQPQDGHEKQDCEMRAAQRWLERHGTGLTAGARTYLGDDLFCHQPLCQQIAEQGQFFVCVCKAESHSTLYDWLKMLDKAGAIGTHSQRRWNGKFGEIWTYRFVNEVPLRAGPGALMVNWFEMTITHEQTGESLYHNAFVTNHVITAQAVEALGRVGRARWKIENEHNNVLKNRGYHFEHNFGHGQQHLSSVLCSLNLLAFLTHTVLQLLDPLYALLRTRLAVRKAFFSHVVALTHYMVFDSWQALLTFMAEGLEIPLPQALPP